MTVYLDTSLIVAAIAREPKTAQAQAWLTMREPTLLITSDWTITEVSSALSLKLRTAQIDIGQRAAALTMFNKLVTESLTVQRVSSRHFRLAATFADRHELGLRAGDALHLATAFDHSATMVTLDKRLAAAGPQLGVPTELLG